MRASSAALRMACAVIVAVTRCVLQRRTSWWRCVLTLSQEQALPVAACRVVAAIEVRANKSTGMMSTVCNKIELHRTRQPLC